MQVAISNVYTTVKPPSEVSLYLEFMFSIFFLNGIYTHPSIGSQVKPK